MTFSDPSFFFFTSSMHFEMIKPSEQWYLMKWVKSTVDIDKKKKNPWPESNRPMC